MAVGEEIASQDAAGSEPGRAIWQEQRSNVTGLSRLRTSGVPAARTQGRAGGCRPSPAGGAPLARCLKAVGVPRVREDFFDLLHLARWMQADSERRQLDIREVFLGTRRSMQASRRRATGGVTYRRQSPRLLSPSISSRHPSQGPPRATAGARPARFVGRGKGGIRPP